MAPDRSAVARSDAGRSNAQTGTGSQRDIGEALFRDGFTAAMGLGPLFNGSSCAECHSDPSLGGMGPGGLATVLRIGVMRGDRFDDLDGRGGPIARAKVLPVLATGCERVPGIPSGINVTSVRNALPLHGLGLVDAIPDSTLVAIAASEPAALRGRVHWMGDAGPTRRAGKFGWKADLPTLELFVANAMRNEHGITNAHFPHDIVPSSASAAGCDSNTRPPKDDGAHLRALTAYVGALAPLPPASTNAAGKAVFEEIQCAVCHTPVIEVGGRAVNLYSDLLLHDVGPLLDDGFTQGSAAGHDWRTTPLWGLSARKRYLHDGRATSLEAAIAAHGGQAAPVTRRYHDLPEQSRQALLAFLRSL
jgi:CxxC motif-containing protein (DUF1111 family)